MQTPFLPGLLSGFSLIVAIGAQNSFVLQQGLRRQHILPITLICAVTDALLIAAGIAGLGAFIQGNATLLAFTRYGGAAFLITYGTIAAQRAWHGKQLVINDDKPVTLKTAISSCLAFTFLNPHVYLDTVVLLGALANQHGETGRWEFGAGAATSSVLWFFSLAYGARLLTPLFRQRKTWQMLDSSIALIMIGLGFWLLLS